jgi:6-phosphogluconolactonase (cycloisomerase 2 family)
MRSSLVVPALLSIMAPAQAANARLFATVYSGTIDTLELVTTTSGNSTLTKTTSAVACGQSPSWLTLDKAAGTLYCSNEGQNPNGSLSSFTVSDSGLAQQAVATTIGSDVNSQLYGGSKGNGFIALAE